MSVDQATYRNKRREQALAAVPSWYSPWAHLAGTTGIGIVVLVIAIWNLEAVTMREWLTIPFVFLFSNAFEWHVHRNVLHRKAPLLTYIYEQHTPMHHGVYITEDMDMRSTKEFKLVLIPSFGVAAIVVAVAPLAYGLAKFMTPNTGWLFLVTSSTYMVLYELTHLMYHLPKDSFLGRRMIVQILRHHHAVHHDPKLMQNWNFNVTLPLFDWLLHTSWKGQTK